LSEPHELTNLHGHQHRWNIIPTKSSCEHLPSDRCIGRKSGAMMGPPYPYGTLQLMGSVFSFQLFYKP
jgi:hypothetical protein